MKIINRSLSFCLVFALLASSANAVTISMPLTRVGDTGHKDTYVRSSSPDSTYGGYAQCLFMGMISDTDITRGYFGFDLSAIPASTTIAGVSLELTTYNGDSGLSGTTPITFELRSTTTWSSGTCTWNNAPALGTLLSELDVAPGNLSYGNPITFDSTTAFVTAAQYAYDNAEWLHFGIKAENEGGSRNLLRMTSLEGTGAWEDLRPVLTVDLSFDAVPGDADIDGDVDEDDAAILAENWLSEAADINWFKGDFSGDGKVDDIDATMMATNWGSSAQAVPEPSTFALVLSIMFATVVFFQRHK